MLVVDDDPSTLEAVRDVLEEAGYGVDTAANGRAALDLLADAPLPDVVGDAPSLEDAFMRLVAS